MKNEQYRSIATACAPAAGTSLHADNQTSRLWSPTQMGAGMVGPESRVLSCVSERHTDSYGSFKGETHRPVVGDIQAHPQVAPLLKAIEWRVGVTTGGTTGLMWRKLPSPGGFSQSWQTSAGVAVHALVDNWGQITADHNAQVYRFEPLSFPGRQAPEFPDIDDLIDELLAEYVIDRLDHPVLARLLNPEPLDPFGPREDSAARDLGEDSDEVY